MDAKRHSFAQDTAGGAASALADTRNRQASTRVSDDVLLDAARQCVLAVGVRRTTLAEIARTAKVSRMTVYRRFPDVRSVLAALMTREFGGLLQRSSSQGMEAATGRDRLVLIATAGVAALSADPLFRTLLDVDAELLLPYIVERFGKTQHFAEQVIVQALQAGHEDASIRRSPNVVAQARSVLLVLQSFAFSLRPASAGLDESMLLDEFTHILDATLHP